MRLVLAAAGSVAGAAWAGEGGAQNVPTGAKTVQAALLPPPGATEVFGYMLWLSARSVRDSAGASTVPGFRADLFANATQFAHTWHRTLFGCNLSSNLIYVVDYARVKIGSLRDENGDLSQFIVQPGVLTWAWRDWHFLSGPLVFLPVGKYQPNDPANATVHYGHYVTFAYEWAVTWMPAPWFEMSLHPTVAFNMRNRRTGYRSGDLEALDWGTMTRPFGSIPAFGVGLGGYWEHQFTDDRRNGAAVPGQRITQNALGPQLQYDFSPGTTIVLKYQHETRAVSSARGNLLWIEFALPLHI